MVFATFYCRKYILFTGAKRSLSCFKFTEYKINIINVQKMFYLDLTRLSTSSAYDLQIVIVSITCWQTFLTFALNVNTALCKQSTIYESCNSYTAQKKHSIHLVNFSGHLICVFFTKWKACMNRVLESTDWTDSGVTSNPSFIPLLFYRFPYKGMGKLIM